MITTKTLVLEWSESQQQFHTIPIEKMLSLNLQRFVNGPAGNDWTPLAFFSTYEEAAEAREILRAEKEKK